MSWIGDRLAWFNGTTDQNTHTPTLDEFKLLVTKETDEYERVLSLKLPRYVRALFRTDPELCPNCEQQLERTWRKAHRHIYYLCERCGYEYVTLYD